MIDISIIIILLVILFYLYKISTNINNKIDNINNKIDDIYIKIENIKDKLQYIFNNLTSLNNNVSYTYNDLNELKTKIDNIINKLNEIENSNNTEFINTRSFIEDYTKPVNNENFSKSINDINNNVKIIYNTLISIFKVIEDDIEKVKTMSGFENSIIDKINKKLEEIKTNIKPIIKTSKVRKNKIDNDLDK